MSRVSEGLASALYLSDVARPGQLPLFTAVTAEPTAEPIYRPDLAHCIYCGAADHYVCTCDNRDNMWPELKADTEIPF